MRTGSFFLALIVACLVLPVAIVVVVAVARLLAGMGDIDGARALDRIALAGGMAWGILLICLILAQAIASLRLPEDDARERRRDD